MSEQIASSPGNPLHVCKHCGGKFHRAPAQMAGHEKGGFCSRKCFGLAKIKPETLICPLCGGKKSWGGKTCMQCRAKKQLKSTPQPCRYCGKPVYRGPAQYQQTNRRMGVFCNKECFSRFQVGPNNASYVHGQSPPDYPKAFKKIRPMIVGREHGLCFLCFAKKKLDVHHIDRDTRNNDPTNLVALCRSCHARQNAKSLAETLRLSNLLCEQLTERHGYPVRFIT